MKGRDFSKVVKPEIKTNWKYCPTCKQAVTEGFDCRKKGCKRERERNGN